MKPRESIAHGKKTTAHQRRGEQRPGVQKTWNGSAAECSEEINTGAGFLPLRLMPISHIIGGDFENPIGENKK